VHARGRQRQSGMGSTVTVSVNSGHGPHTKNGPRFKTQVSMLCLKAQRDPRETSTNNRSASHRTKHSYTLRDFTPTSTGVHDCVMGMQANK
jgi:hypothetical protein